jgi:UDP-N-acetylenolpyruvoylglucosamine reductase
MHFNKLLKKFKKEQQQKKNTTQHKNKTKGITFKTPKGTATSKKQTHKHKEKERSN